MPNVNAHEGEWSPVRGLLRGTVVAALVGAAAAVGLCVIASQAPALIWPGILRFAVAFGLTWVLCRLIERSAGFAGDACSWVATILCFFALLSQHLVLATDGLSILSEVNSAWLFPAAFAGTLVPNQTPGSFDPRWFGLFPIAVMTGLPCLLGCGLLWWIERIE